MRPMPAHGTGRAIDGGRIVDGRNNLVDCFLLGSYIDDFLFIARLLCGRPVFSSTDFFLFFYGLSKTILPIPAKSLGRLLYTALDGKPNYAKSNRIIH